MPYFSLAKSLNLMLTAWESIHIHEGIASHTEMCRMCNSLTGNMGEKLRTKMQSSIVIKWYASEEEIIHQTPLGTQIIATQCFM